MTERALTKAEMADVFLRVAEGDSPAADAIIATYEILMGVEGWATAETVDPKHFGIPGHQWEEIADLIGETERERDPLAAVNGMLTWLNVGPSAVTV